MAYGTVRNVIMLFVFENVICHRSQVKRSQLRGVLYLEVSLYYYNFIYFPKQNKFFFLCVEVLQYCNIIIENNFVAHLRGSSPEAPLPECALN